MIAVTTWLHKLCLALWQTCAQISTSVFQNVQVEDGWETYQKHSRTTEEVVLDTLKSQERLDEMIAMGNINWFGETDPWSRESQAMAKNTLRRV